MRTRLLLIALLSACTTTFAQSATADAAQVCIYVDNVPGMNPWMTDAHRERIRTKLVTVVNKSGAVHAGLGSFLLYPQLDIMDVTVTDAGMKPITVAKIEAVLNVARLDRLDAPLSKPGTVFNSMTMQLIGTGNDTATAVNDAIGKIQASDPNIGKFLKETRERIMTYYQEHCTEVVNEGVRAYEMKNYPLSIAMLYSVPEGTPCSDNAREFSIKAYHEYQKVECQKQLAQLKSKSVIMKGPDASAAMNQQQYREVLQLVKSMDPTAEGCYDEAYKMLDKLSADFDAENKKNFDMLSKLIDSETQVQTEMYKAMGRINSQVQPGGTTVVVVK
jgi:hypothetical protein